MHKVIRDHSFEVGVALTAGLVLVLVTREILRIRTGIPGGRVLAVAGAVLIAGFAVIVVARFAVLA